MKKWYTQDIRKLVKSIPVPQQTAPIMVVEFETHIAFAIHPVKNVVYNETVKLATDAYLAKIYALLTREQVPTRIHGFYSDYGYHKELQETKNAENR